MRLIQGCTLDAREALAHFHKQLSKQTLRVVYLSDQARFRGMALWAMHRAGDTHAKAVATPDQAQRWFASQEQRAQGAILRTETLIASIKRNLAEAKRNVEGR